MFTFHASRQHSIKIGLAHGMGELIAIIVDFSSRPHGDIMEMLKKTIKTKNPIFRAAHVSVDFSTKLCFYFVLVKFFST